MKAKDQQNLIFRVIQFGLDKESFTLTEAIDNKVLTTLEASFFYNYYVWNSGSTQNTNHVLLAKGRTNDYNNKNDWTYTVLPTAIFQYIDYLEIVEARKAATEARRLSWIAIWISCILGVFGLVVGLLQIYFSLNNS